MSTVASRDDDCLGHLLGLSHLPLWPNWLERLACNAVVAGSNPAGFFLLFTIKMLQLFFLYLFLLVCCLFIICLDIFLCMTRLDLSKNSKIFFMS